MTYTIEVVPFSEYDWTFEKEGWINLNPTAVALISAFCGIALWMSLELLVLVHLTFKRRTGLYFFSIVITTLGIILQTTGYLLKAFENPWPPVLVTIICKVGWVSNVSGFSLVLWSRLHLIVTNPRVLRLVLCMIIFNAICLHTPIVVFEFYLLSPSHRERFLYPMEVMERLQQTVFTLQEVVISGLYIYHTARFLNDGFAERTRRVVGLLIAVQVIAISFDAGLTTFDYLNMFTLKCTLHPFVYSVKLKLEFIVLNQLLGIVKKGLMSGVREGNFPDLMNSAGGGGVGGSGSGEGGGRKETVGVVSDEGLGMRGGSWSSNPSAVTVGSEMQRGGSEYSNEQCLTDVVGRPDEDGGDSGSDENSEVRRVEVEERYVADDVERQYLGKFMG